MRLARSISILCPAAALAGSVAGPIPAACAEGYNPAAVRKYKQQAARGLCPNGGEWIRCYGIEPYNCVDTLTPIIDPCVDKVLAHTERLDRHQYREWFGEELYGCIKEDFLKRHGPKKTTTGECAD